eukprot:TRINITY_DN15133_c0_g1_i1.p1 TRINITY_DN15133_c0_g1~~TRINITY_DN15133_c0_g1_i1.p1  ORF type:complete len:306 (+),score=35.28 TRINITY_DN15133_c0_g1_i1:123-1040(+)
MEERLCRDFDRATKYSREIAINDRHHKDHLFVSAVSPQNSHKNRYHDVLPLEETRVKLVSIPGLLGSDYINANYINDGKSNCYIASQAPIPSTINDFWRMVWEQNSPLIVMLTRLQEGNNVKAHPYWPETRGEEFNAGDHIKITLRENPRIEKFGITIRKLHVEHLGLRVSRMITQLHFSDWPDNGVPSKTASIRAVLHLHEMFRSRNHVLTGPTVVHCSAGIGRAGTFIAIDMLFRKIVQSTCAEEGNNYSSHLYNILLDLRKQRRGMVQTFEQYRFIIQVLSDTIDQWSESHRARKAELTQDR